MRITTALAVAGLCLCSAACTPELPEAGTRAAELYRVKCTDGCHEIYRPGSMTPKMWETMMKRMVIDIRQAGHPPLTPEEYATILDYLRRHSYRP